MIDGKKVLFSGMQATGNLTLGNYLGALKNWVSLSDEYECFYSVVDMHSITVRQDPAVLRKRARALLTLYIAAGLDPEKNCIYYQSHVSAHAELAWMHHKGRNRHHYEYWNDYNAVREEGKSPIIYVQMPRKYVVEMLMDRISASETYRGAQYTQHDPLKYFLNGRGRTLMHPQTAKELERMLRILDRRGQAELDRFVRDYYLKGYPV